MVSTVSCNGNLLLNVGPTADGRILPAFEQRLLEMGAWLEVGVTMRINSFCETSNKITPKKDKPPNKV